MAREPFRERFPEHGRPEHGRPEHGRPLPTEGGITARSRRGAIGESWWSGRFLAVLESLGVGGRLARGKNYARAGQVTDLSIDPGAVTAIVQGSRAEPYRVRIGLRPFADEAWEAVEEAFARDSWYAASLLAGEVPGPVRYLEHESGRGVCLRLQLVDGRGAPCQRRPRWHQSLQYRCSFHGSP